ncbi:MAG: NAD(P)/FAD-dependent oxidoreductase [Maricaulaceae bacterium]
MCHNLEANYLIIGSGAVGMAFADTLLTETNASVIIVDRFAKPGGHWNVAYPFVTLHQPSNFYGVNSRELSKGRKDKTGLNKGLGDLASGAEIMAYFDDVMRHNFLPTGRVQYFPLCDYQTQESSETPSFTSLLTGEKYTVKAAKIVDATYLKTTVPSTHTPNFTIGDGVQFMPPNDLPKLTTPADEFTVIGGGKTGIDSCLWLLENGVNPDKICWIVSRDAWLLNRKNTQPSPEFFAHTMGAQAGQFESIANSTSVEDMFDRLESCGYFLRIDESVRPSMFHGATISELEVEALRRIKNVVRMGRVSSVGQTEITLANGTIPTTPNTVHVDCSASAITNLDNKPVFQGDLITPQMVRSYQPIFSAAFIAHIEATRETETEKNRLCAPVPLPDGDADFIKMTAAFMMNQYNWSQEPDLRQWLRGSRLDGFSKMVAEMDKTDASKIAIMEKLRVNSMPAMMKLQGYLAALS